MSKYLSLFLILILSLMVITGCSKSEKQETGKITVAVSIIPQKTFVNKIGGNEIEVVTMIPRGYSPGNYEPSPQELRKFSDAEIYFSMGVPADVNNILPKAKEINPDIKVVKLFEEIENEYPPREFSGGSRDPHLWLSPSRVISMLEIMKEELIKIDETQAELYEENARNYINEIKQADAEIREILSALENKSFLIYHPVLGYFAQEYNLNMISVQKEGKEASARRLENIIKLSQEKNLGAIFYQAEIDSKQTETLAAEMNGKAVKIDPLAPDYIKTLKEIARLIEKY